MRVLLLHHDTQPTAATDGDAVHALARGLASRGVTVDMVTAGARDGADAELLWDGNAVTEGLFTVHRVRCRRPGALGYLSAAIPVARRLLERERYDVVHVAPALPAGGMIPFLDLHGAPLVATLHGPDVPPAPHRVTSPLIRWLWRRADRVIAASDAVGLQARRTLPELRYAVVPAGVDLARFRPRLRAGRIRDRVRCLAVSPLREGRGLDRLVRAVAAQARGTVELELVGAGPLEGALHALAAGLGVSELVRFAGPADRVTLAQRYREADIFTLVSTDPLPGGSPYIEAMASGLPIVAGITAAPDVIRDGRNGILVPPADEPAIAAAIRGLAGSPRLRAELGRRNRADAEEHFAWDRITARHLSIYNGVQRHAPARPLFAEQPSSTW